MRSWRIIGLFLCMTVFFGCSATTLRCGTDGDKSYVDLINVPSDIGVRVDDYTELCGFADSDGGV